MPELLVDIDALDLTQNVFDVEDMQKILIEASLLYFPYTEI